MKLGSALFIVVVLWFAAVVFLIWNSHNKHQNNDISKNSQTVPRINSANRAKSVNIITDNQVKYVPEHLNASKYVIPEYITRRLILFDWPYHSDNFTYLNYKSFESFLVRGYSESVQIDMMLIGHGVINYYKVDGVFSKHTFTKYNRKGYSFSTSVYTNASSLFTANDYTKESQVKVYGKEFFDSELSVCCSKQISAKINNVRELRFAFAFYSRIARLYSTGGEYYDLSWFHNKRYTKTGYIVYYMQGVYVANYCYNTTTFQILPEPGDPRANYLDAGDHEFRCAASTVLVFPLPKNLVLQCLLEEYDNLNSKLFACFRRQVDSKRSNLKTYYEARCIEIAVRRCFASNQLINGVWSGHFAAAFENDIAYGSNEGFALPSTIDELKATPLMFLGPRAVSGQWLMPDSSSFLSTAIANNDRALRIFSRQNLDQYRLTSNFKKCPHYSSDEFYKASDRLQSSISCSPSFVVPGYMKAGTTYLFDILSKHPLILPALRGYGFKETGCYITTSRLMAGPERMNCFPFVESDEGFIYGDGTVYYIHHHYIAKNLRADNPNLKAIIILRNPTERTRSHHSFAYSQLLERGVGNMNDIVNLCLSPGTRVDLLSQLVVPALQYVKQYGFSSPGEPLLKFVEYATTIWTARMPGLEISDNAYQRAGNVILTSVYFHHIFEWDQLFGIDNVYVIEGERITFFRSKNRLIQKALRSSKPLSTVKEQVLPYTSIIMNKTLEEEIGDIFRFLGVNPMADMPTVYQHRTSSVIDPSHKINATSKARLEKFYEPFNELLSLYLRYRKTVRRYN